MCLLADWGRLVESFVAETWATPAEGRSGGGLVCNGKGGLATRYVQRFLSALTPSLCQRLLATAAVVLFAAEARGQGTGYFGPEQPLQIRPEVDAYYHLGEDFRLLGQLQTNFIPVDSNSSATFGAFADWMIAAVFRPLLSPDLAKSRALNLRFGVQYATTINPGSLKSSQSVVLQEDVTPRYFLPWSILISSRNRFQESWSLSNAGSFTFRYLGRIQFEREFNVGEKSLTPFVNAQLSWSSPPAMWTQFKMEVGLQYGPHWFGRGQILEINFSVITKLQPSHSWSPALGLIWYMYF